MSEVIGVHNEWFWTIMMAMITGDGWGLSFPDMHHTVEENPQKNLNQEN